MVDLVHRVDLSIYQSKLDELLEDKRKYTIDYYKWEESNATALVDIYMSDKNILDNYSIWSKAMYVVDLINKQLLENEINELTKPIISIKGN